MRIDLQSKLASYVDIVDLKESDVVYILVQIGKIIEQSGTKEQYDTLWFYRNWVAHAEIGGQTSFVKKLKEKFKSLHKSEEIISPRLFGFVAFLELKNEIIRFYHQQVQNNLIPSKKFLSAFQKSLIQVIADIPVTLLIDEENKIVISYDKVGHLNIQGPGTYSGSIRILE